MGLSVRFWGVRGSIPSPGARTVRYGGNTPCTELRTSGGWLVILDAGTGIRELGQALMARAQGKPVKGDIFLTHAHWDHIQGIPFFAPIFQGGNHFTIWGSKSLETSIDRVVRDQMSPVVFPVSFDELDARIDFQEIGEDEKRDGGGYIVSAYHVQHPGGALAYKFSDVTSPDRTLVYVSDNELSAHPSYASAAGWRAGMTEFVRGATALVHDATYTRDEYSHHRGWGHSAYDDALELAVEAGVELLVLFHHKPERSDEEIDQQLDQLRQAARQRGSKLRIEAAAEGMSLTV